MNIGRQPEKCGVIHFELGDKSTYIDFNSRNDILHIERGIMTVNKSDLESPIQLSGVLKISIQLNHTLQPVTYSEKAEPCA